MKCSSLYATLRVEVTAIYYCWVYIQIFLANSDEDRGSPTGTYGTHYVREILVQLGKRFRLVEEVGGDEDIVNPSELTQMVRKLMQDHTTY